MSPFIISRPGIKKENYYVFIMILIALTPNLFSLFFVSTKNAILLFALSLFLILLPTLIFKKKTWLFLVFFYVLFSPFEIITLFTTKTRINNVILASIFTTSRTEALELFFSTFTAFLFCVALIILYVFFLKQIKTNNYLSKKYRLAVLLLFVVTVAIQFVKVSPEKDTINSRARQTITVLKTRLSYSVFPTNLIYNSAIFANEKFEEKGVFKKLSKFSFDAKKDSGMTEVVVLILGESSRATNWSLDGYPLLTNPTLEKEDGIFFLKNTYASTNSTYRSIPMLLTKSTPQNREEWKKSETIMKAFKESGYYTTWIGGQSKDHNVVKLAARQAYSVNFETGFDLTLIEDAKKIISSKLGNIFIIIHTYGSHYNYRNRYPQEFDFFKPSNYINAGVTNKVELINAYNNSILYTDYVLSNLIDYLKKDSRATCLYFTSDHGENLLDDEHNLLFHVQGNPTKYELHVPTLIWLSPNYRCEFPDKVVNLTKNLNKKMSTIVTFQSVLDLGNISYPKEDKSLSIFSPMFKEFSKRFALTNLKDVVEVE